MTLIAVCGIPGAGKSTISARLQSLGYDAMDTDRDGFAGWRDKGTRLPVADPADWHDPILTADIEYTVTRARVEQLRARANTEEHPVYRCGFAGGEDEYWDLFDEVIVVGVDNETLRHRLATRTSNSFGKAAHERDGVLLANVGWAESYRSRGAMIIDGTAPLDSLVAELVAIGEAAHQREIARS